MHPARAHLLDLLLHVAQLALQAVDHLHAVVHALSRRRQLVARGQVALQAHLRSSGTGGGGREGSACSDRHGERDAAGGSKACKVAQGEDAATCLVLPGRPLTNCLNYSSPLPTLLPTLLPPSSSSSTGGRVAAAGTELLSMKPVTYSWKAGSRMPAGQVLVDACAASVSCASHFRSRTD